MRVAVVAEVGRRGTGGEPQGFLLALAYFGSGNCPQVAEPAERQQAGHFCNHTPPPEITRFVDELGLWRYCSYDERSSTCSLQLVWSD